MALYCPPLSHVLWPIFLLCLPRRRHGRRRLAAAAARLHTAPHASRIIKSFCPHLSVGAPRHPASACYSAYLLVELLVRRGFNPSRPLDALDTQSISRVRRGFNPSRPLDALDTQSISRVRQGFNPSRPWHSHSSTRPACQRAQSPYPDSQTRGSWRWASARDRTCQPQALPRQGRRAAGSNKERMEAGQRYRGVVGAPVT